MLGSLLREASGAASVMSRANLKASAAALHCLAKNPSYTRELRAHGPDSRHPTVLLSSTAVVIDDKLTGRTCPRDNDTA